MMKKSIFTLVFVAIIGWVSAQTLQFEFNGQAFSNGERIVCTNLLEWGELQQDMQLRNLTNGPLDVMVEKEEVQIVEGTSNYFCWGSCYTPEVFISPRPVSMAAGELSGEGGLSFHHQIDPEFSGDPNNFIAGTSVVKYHAYPSGAEDQKVTIEVWVAYEAENVSEQVACSLGHAYPNPATSVVNFDYSVAAGANASVEVYNLVGQKVMSQQVNTTQSHMAISVADLTEGIYFCNLFVNGQAVKTEKFIVKK